MTNNLYRIVEARNLTTKEVFWRVYDGKQIDGIADYPTVIEAAKAVERFKAADKRRSRVISNVPQEREADDEDGKKLDKFFGL